MTRFGRGGGVNTHQVSLVPRYSYRWLNPAILLMTTHQFANLRSAERDTLGVLLDYNIGQHCSV
jgi:hypothetical protein